MQEPWQALIRPIESLIWQLNKTVFPISFHTLTHEFKWGKNRAHNLEATTLDKLTNEALK